MKTPEPEIDRLRRENAALTKLYVVASQLRQFPVPFDDHFALVGAVDECRAVLEPPVDDYAPPAKSAWQAHVDAHPREEFLAVFRQAHATLHRLWTDAVGKPGYDKPAWRLVDNALGRFARDAAEKVGISRSEPLL
ncbi:MAG TPA: hypothetical protein VLE97_07270 [Gaiellaceae bacterium]|nr:hypothetical protein [Gaiellaceae bacterium]